LKHFSMIKIYFLLLILFLFKWRTWVVIWAVSKLLFANIFFKQICGVRERKHGSLLPMTNSFFIIFFINLFSWTCKSSNQFENSFFLYLLFILFFNIYLFLFCFYYLILNYLIFIICYLLFSFFNLLLLFFLIVIF